MESEKEFKEQNELLVSYYLNLNEFSSNNFSPSQNFQIKLIKENSDLKAENLRLKGEIEVSQNHLKFLRLNKTLCLVFLKFSWNDYRSMWVLNGSGSNCSLWNLRNGIEFGSCVFLSSLGFRQAQKTEIFEKQKNIGTSKLMLDFFLFSALEKNKWHLAVLSKFHRQLWAVQGNVLDGSRHSRTGPNRFNNNSKKKIKNYKFGVQDYASLDYISFEPTLGNR